MTEVDRRLGEYIAEHRAGGEADPGTHVARASPADRAELAALIDAYLAGAPRRAFDADDFRGSRAEHTVLELERVLGGQSGLWPALLPRLRDRAGLKRREVVERLAVALGVGGKTDKVAAYYHQMEQGLLPAYGVADQVLEALGQIVGESREALREAGRPRQAPGSGPGAQQPAFARVGQPDASTTPPRAAPPDRAADWDTVDELFRGG